MSDYSDFDQEIDWVWRSLLALVAGMFLLLVVAFVHHGEQMEIEDQFAKQCERDGGRSLRTQTGTYGHEMRCWHKDGRLLYTEPEWRTTQ